MPPPYYDQTKALLQTMAGGSVYTPEWYIALALNGSNPWTTSRASWELSGTATLLTTGWVEDPAWANSYYEAGIQNTTTVDITCSTPGSVRYYIIRDGLANPRWMFMGQLMNYPLAVAAGDKVRFPAGSLKIVVNN